MTDHYREAEWLSKPQPEGFQRLHSEDELAAASVKMRPADLAAEQLHATLAVADQLARIATAPEQLAGAQEGPEPR